MALTSEQTFISPNYLTDPTYAPVYSRYSRVSVKSTWNHETSHSRPPCPTLVPPPRTVTKLIRQSGSMLGKLLVQGSTSSNQLALDDPNLRNLAAEASRLGHHHGTTQTLANLLLDLWVVKNMFHLLYYFTYYHYYFISMTTKLFLFCWFQNRRSSILILRWIGTNLWTTTV